MCLSLQGRSFYIPLFLENIPFWIKQMVQLHELTLKWQKFDFTYKPLMLRL